MLLEKIIVLIILLFAFGCDFGTNSRTDIPFYQEILEDHTYEYSYPDSGYFYSYIFSDYKEKINNVEKMLYQYFNEGIVVYNAWYREGANGCLLPNGGRTTAIYLPVFILMTTEKYSELENKNFYEIHSPQPIGCCGCYVTRYYLVN